MTTFVVSISMIALLVPSTVLAEDLSFGGGVTVIGSGTGSSTNFQIVFVLEGSFTSVMAYRYLPGTESGVADPYTRGVTAVAALLSSAASE